MGCCVSSAGDEHRCSGDGGAIQAALEEEAVKEVLLEAPGKLSADEFVSQMGPGKQGLAPPPANVLIRTDRLKSYTEKIVSEEVLNGNECCHNVAANSRNDGELNQRLPMIKWRQPTGGNRRVPARTPVAPEKTSQARPFRGGQVRNEGSVQRSTPPMTRIGRGTRRSLSGGMENSGGAFNGVVPGEELETLENPIVSLECFIFL